jgi:uncharacterized protein (TIGR00369 family)
MDAQELERFIQEHFPAARELCQVTNVGDQTIEVRLPFRDEFLRPGGTVSGPTLMGLADTATYLLVLSMVGPVALAVTTSLNINFIRKPPPEDVIASGRLLKLGRRLAVAEVHIMSASTRALVAQATVTYSLPPTPAL